MSKKKVKRKVREWYVLESSCGSLFYGHRSKRRLIWIIKNDFAFPDHTITDIIKVREVLR